MKSNNHVRVRLATKFPGPLMQLLNDGPGFRHTGLVDDQFLDLLLEPSNLVRFGGLC
jgi:hypothetical protein